MVLTSEQLHNFNAFRERLAFSLRKMHDSESNPYEKLMLAHVLRNVVLVPINFKQGYYLTSNESSVVFGENLKRSRVEKTTTGIEIPHIDSVIRIPIEHLFSGNGLNPAGVMTLLHEYSHIVLPVTAYRYTRSLGLPLHMADELFADLLAVRIANKTNVPKHAITAHILRRQANYGSFPFARRLLGYKSRTRRRGNFIEIPFKKAEKAIFSPFRARMR